MLDLSVFDVEMLAYALQDDTYETSWWVDPATGELIMSVSDEEAEDFDMRGMVFVRPQDSRSAYRDMVIFTATVEDAQLNGRLSRALQGRGAFRRFKDVLYDQDQARQEWFDFRDVRTKGRVFDWLADQELISRRAADVAIDALDEEEPDESQGGLHAVPDPP